MGVRDLLGDALALALPPRCPGCGAVVRGDHRFCVDCWGSLDFLGPPWCATCCLPFAIDRGPDAQCGACLEKPPRHAGARAAVAYGPVARTLALRLKYGGRLAFATTAARLMARHLPDDADLLVPVPLHRWRLWGRGFNQAALIAAALARTSGVAHDSLVLRRTRRTPALKGMNPRQRRQAVRAVFAIEPERRDRLKDRHVALIDDVYTSGATADACTRALLKSGAAKVTVLCWARVVGDALD
ncbi:ComF family protein [Sphingomonas bacterium]|uniref:ComF family protein n=1 Tax=Sphingomonas bacterium TaxID=1895847 RepID=UPI002623576B|nr:ComF family protein [Sphingomonas bacterium]MDB5679802.1 ComF family protein [Sphingomonas bacterium]